MSETNFNVSGIKQEFAEKTRPELLPTNERIMDNVSYLAAFIGGCVSIGTFSMGASLIGVLNLTQAILAMAIGCSVIALALVMSGREIGRAHV